MERMESTKIVACLIFILHPMTALIWKKPRTDVSLLRANSTNIIAFFEVWYKIFTNKIYKRKNLSIDFSYQNFTLPFDGVNDI